MLVERDVESAILEASLTECLSGKGGVVAVSGPVGSGKTSLLQTFARQAVDSGFTFLNAKGSRTERNVPMGLMGQVFGGADLPEEVTDRILRLLDDAATTTTPRDREDEATEQVDVQVLRGLTEVLLELSERAPLLIGIDDAHSADATSMQYLLYLARRIDRARIIVMINETGGIQHPWPMLAAELRSLPNSRQLRLNLLSPTGVAAVLAEHPDLRGVDPAFWQRLSGGNPALLSALIEDHRSGKDKSPRAAAGEAFAQAVLNSLYRGDESMLPVARALAVLGEPTCPALLTDLLVDSCASPADGLKAGTEAGILDAGRFRHQRSATAVLEAMSPHDRANLHERVAEFLYRQGAPAVKVARHKVAAHRASASWSVPLLQEAAEQALDDDDTALALDCLRLAERGPDGDTDCPRIEAALLRTKWRLDPAAAQRYVPGLVKAARGGTLPASAAALLLNHLAWFGRAEEAADVLAAIGASASADTPDNELALHAVRSRFAYLCPEVAHRVPPGPARPRVSTLAASNGKLLIRTAAIVDALRQDGITEEAVSDARAILQQHRLDDHTWGAILTALETMVYAECLDEAMLWCDALLEEAEDRRVPTWCALLSAIRAGISFRQGGLCDAERYAEAALSYIKPKGLGVFIGVPLSILLLVAIKRAQFDEAFRLFAMPVPDAMFRTPFGLHYLRARGRFHLARRNYKAAIEDFEACGELMVRWGLDIPGIVPWRTDLAEARLGLGTPTDTLVADQLAKLGPFNRRTRGISLRVLAATKDLKQRVPVLAEAVDELQVSGDQLELVETLAELSEAQHGSGEYIKARVTRRRTQQLVVKHGLQSFLPARSEAEVASESVEGHMIDELSDAERRVASLAVRGHTNQQIARKLFITVSTVEQHLTRVYRKLHINRRSDLPFSLAASLRSIA